jgi:hypothetical protein
VTWTKVLALPGHVRVRNLLPRSGFLITVACACILSGCQPTRFLFFVFGNGADVHHNASPGHASLRGCSSKEHS